MPPDNVIQPPQLIQGPGGDVPPSIIAPSAPDPRFMDRHLYTPESTPGGYIYNPHPTAPPRGPQASLRLRPQGDARVKHARKRDYGFAVSTKDQPLRYGQYLKWESNTLIRGLWRLENEVLERGIFNGLNTAGKYMQAYAINNAPWEDRTYQARSGLTYSIGVPDFTNRAARGAGTQIQLDLAHTVHYGIYLELPGITNTRKAHPIIAPTLLHFSPMIGVFIKKAILLELQKIANPDKKHTRIMRTLLSRPENLMAEAGRTADMNQWNKHMSRESARRRQQLLQSRRLPDAIEARYDTRTGRAEFYRRGEHLDIDSLSDYEFRRGEWYRRTDMSPDVDEAINLRGGKVSASDYDDIEGMLKSMKRRNAVPAPRRTVSAEDLEVVYDDMDIEAYMQLYSDNPFDEHSGIQNLDDYWD